MSLSNRRQPRRLRRPSSVQCLGAGSPQADGVERTSEVSLIHQWESERTAPQWHGDVNRHLGPLPTKLPGRNTDPCLENDAVRWVGTGAGPSDAFASTDTPRLNTDTVILHGEDAYVGLTAYLLIDRQFFGTATFASVIFPGELPPVSEPLAG